MSVGSTPGTRHQDSAVELRGVSKTFRRRARAVGLKEAVRVLRRPEYREIRALDDVTFSAERGTILAYAGPNGAGKSTTLRIISGLMAPDAGGVQVLGRRPQRDRLMLMRRMAVVFGQRTDLWWDLPVMASYHWKRAVWQIPDSTFDEMLDYTTGLLSLDDLLDVPARELSLGQRMRADLGFALLHAPELILLDEPTLGLDVDVKARLIDGLRGLNRDRGVTAIVTSHDITDLESLADRLLLLHEGRIRFDGTFDELRREAGAKTYLSMRAAEPPAFARAQRVDDDGEASTYAFSYGDHDAISRSFVEAQAVARPGSIRLWEQSISDVVVELYRSWSPLPPAQRGAVSAGAVRGEGE